MGGPSGGRTEKTSRLSGASLGSKNLFNKFTPLLFSFRCAFSDMRRLLEPCWWILFLKITSSVLHYVVCFPALTEGYVGTLQETRQGSSVQIRRRKASGDPYWAYSGECSCVG